MHNHVSFFDKQAVRVAVRSGALDINNEGMKPNSDCASQEHDDTDGKCFCQLYTVLSPWQTSAVPSFIGSVVYYYV